jgi:hypothetical protein
MGVPEKDPKRLAAIHERIFGERNRAVTEARARVIDTMTTGSGTIDALDALERAVEKRAAEMIRDKLSETVQRYGPSEADEGWLDAADLVDPEVP